MSNPTKKNRESHETQSSISQCRTIKKIYKEFNKQPNLNRGYHQNWWTEPWDWDYPVKNKHEKITKQNYKL